jgi:rare lipoprotein A
MTASPANALLVLSVLLSSAAAAAAAEFGELPQSVDAPPPAVRRPDFRNIFRDVAPIRPAEAAEPATAPPPAETGAGAAPAATASSPTPPAAALAAAPVRRARPFARGLAAWYQHKGKTASGAKYNPNDLTAAHNSLPFGARVRVVYEKTGREVTVRVTDRISRKALRRHALTIELSRQGAQKIGLDGVGTVSLYQSN